jgi:rhomboid family protein
MFPIHDDTERLHGKPYINYSLIAINSLVFIWEIAATGYFTDIQATREIFFLYGAIPEFVLAGNIPSIMTSMFMHDFFVRIW